MRERADACFPSSRGSSRPPRTLCTCFTRTNEHKNTYAARAPPSGIDTQRKGERHAVAAAAAAAAAVAAAAAEDQRVVLGLQVCLKAAYTSSLRPHTLVA